MTLDIAAIKARADKAARKWASSDFYQDSAEDIPDLLAALEASEAARVKAEQERDALKDCEESAYQRGVSDERKRAEKAENTARRALEQKT